MFFRIRIHSSAEEEKLKKDYWFLGGANIYLAVDILDKISKYCNICLYGNYPGKSLLLIMMKCKKVIKIKKGHSPFFIIFSP